MKIWVDADACPVAIREMLFRAADRRGINVTLVANQALRVPASPNIDMLKVGAGFDIADNAIVQRVAAGELVITSDIPLAAEVIGRGATALSPRGEAYTDNNIRDRLTMRDFMDTLRGSGIATGGPPPLSQSDRQAFANALDRWITRSQAEQ
ncbi:MAG: YaiI/YqxD family protein [Gammaproteobacteria bacterium]